MRPKTSDPLVDSDTGLPRTPVAWRHRELHLPQTNLMSSSYYQPIHQPLPSVISSNHHQHHQFQNHQQYHHQNPHLHHNHNHHQQQQQQQQQSYSQSYHLSQQNSQHHHHPSSSNQRTSSPSVLTTSSDDREEVPMVRHHHHSSSRRHNGSVYSTTIDRRRSKHHSQSIVPRPSMARGSIVSYGPGPMRNYQRTATLRSTRSFPGLVMAQVGTFDGEPCPVHGSNHHLHPGPYPPPPPTASLTMNPRHLSMASHHPIVNPYEHAASSSLLAHPVHSQPMLTVKRFNSLSDLRRPSLQPLIAYPVNGSALGLGSPQGAPTPSNYDCSGKSLGNKLPLPTYVGTMFRNNNGSTSFVPSGASMMIPGHGPAPIEAIKSHLANQVNPLIYDDTVCCKGHLIVLWIILTVVTIGVISGIILGVTAN